MYRTIHQYAVGLIIALGFWVMVIVASFVTDDSPVMIEQVASSGSICLTSHGAQDDYDNDPHMLEDESPWTGLFGGHLVDYYGTGVATYSDGTVTDGQCWYLVADAPELAQGE